MSASARPALTSLDEDLVLELYRAYREDLGRLNRRMRALGFVGMFGDVEGELLYLLARHARPEVVFEASPHEGWTSCYLLQALADNGAGTLHSFDLHAASEARVPEDLKPRRRFHCGDLRQSLELVPASIDLCLMDSDHTFEFATWYIEHVWPRVRPGGVCAVHDVYDTNLATFDANRQARTEVSAVLEHLERRGIPHLAIGHECGFLPRLRAARQGLVEELGLVPLNSDNNAALFFLAP